MTGAPGTFGRALCASSLLLVLGCSRKERLARADTGDGEGAAGAPAVVPTAPARQVAPDELRRAIGARLEAGRPRGTSAEQWRCVRALYDHTGGLPVWFDSTGGDGRAPALARALADVPDHGLVVQRARLDSLRAALLVARDTSAGAAERVAAADVRLSEGFVVMAGALVSGQLDPRTVTRGWYIDPRRSEVDSAILRRATAEPVDSLVATLAPDDPVYAALRAELAHYRGIVARGGWGTVSAGPTLRPGNAGDPARIEALVRRLRSEGYLPEGARGAGVYDSTLAAAVASFQAHHAIAVDGILGPGVVKVLNVPAAYRATQIAANLERIRWLPHGQRGRYLIVNVPSFRLLLRDGDRTVGSMKVVVGAEYDNDRFTPVFADSMSFVIFQPYWNVTPSIALSETIPKASRDPGYLARNDYEVVRGDGDDARVVSAAQLTRSAVRAGRVRVRQRPGTLNALGHVKFIFPNAFNIYLHDTPQRELFERDVRAFSHGCIRVERPAELAAWVLGWDSTRVAAAMTGPQANQYVPVAPKLPVFIIYLTAFTRDGELFFGNDLYGRDDALVARLRTAALPDARVTAAAAALREWAGPPPSR